MPMSRKSTASKVLHYAPSDKMIANGDLPFTRCGLCIFAGIPGAGRKKQTNTCWTNVLTDVTCKNCLFCMGVIKK